METRTDALQVIRDGRNGALGPGINLPAATGDVHAVLADLARAVNRDLSTPDLAPATERAYAHDWADFAAFCARHGLDALPAAPQTLVYLKSLETARSPGAERLPTTAAGRTDLHRPHRPRATDAPAASRRDRGPARRGVP